LTTKISKKEKLIKIKEKLIKISDRSPLRLAQLMGTSYYIGREGPMFELRTLHLIILKDEILTTRLHDKKKINDIKINDITL
jgi:hypothetical protein